jgi:hypothetical protein
MLSKRYETPSPLTDESSHTRDGSAESPFVSPKPIVTDVLDESRKQS